MMKRMLWIVMGGLSGLLLSAAYLDFELKDTYRSTAVLRFTNEVISGRYAPSRPFRHSDLMRIADEQFLSRAAAQNVIMTHNLYAEDIRTTPMEDLVERLRKSCEMQTTLEGSVRISFTSTEQELAKKVNDDLTGPLIASQNMDRRKILPKIIETLADRLHTAACKVAVVESNRQLGNCDDDAARARAATHSLDTSTSYLAPESKLITSTAEHRPMDLELAKEEYKAWRGKLAEARVELTLEGMQYGPMLNIEEPATDGVLTRWPVSGTLGTGLGAGMALGYALSMLASCTTHQAPQQ